MKLLVCLVSQAGRVVSKQRIIEQVWDGQVTTDDAVTAAIYSLRKALGDEARRPRYVETIPKRGYRVLSQPAAEPSHPTIRSLAVLPLKSVPQDADNEELAEGLTAAFITELARLTSLRVISRTSIRGYRGTTKGAPEIARELNVDAILEGTVMRSGDRVRIDSRLIDASRDTHLWVESYERDLADVLELQAELASSIARGIHVFVGSERAGSLASRSKVSREAMEAYLKGLAFLDTASPASLTQAKLYLERALELQPHFAEGFAGLANCYVSMIYLGRADNQELAVHARRAAKAAIALNPDLGEAHASHAIVLGFADRNFPAAEVEFRRALHLQPQLSRARRRYALMLVAMERHAEASRQCDEAVKLDPLNLTAHADVGEVRFLLRQYERVIEEMKKALQLDPRFGMAYLKTALAHWQLGNMDEFHANYRTATKIWGASDSFLRDVDSAFQSDGPPGLFAVVARATERRDPDRPFHLPELIMTYAAAGDRERALSFLERAYQQQSPYLAWTIVSPYVDPIRNEPRFISVVSRLKTAVGLSAPNLSP